MKEKNIPFSLPFIGDEEILELIDTIKSGWLTTGPKSMQFEEDFARYIGCKHAIAVNSCTAALHLSLDAIDVKPDDLVITTPMTFAATAEVIRYFGAKPLFVDIEEHGMNISPSSIENTLMDMERYSLLKRVKAIIPVHMAGHPCDMDPILEVAGKYGIKIVEDAAHTLPARYKGRMIGTIGDTTAFSFYANKCITTGEGGMVTTDNDEYAEKMRMMRLHGINKDAWKRYTKEGSWRWEIKYPGYKYNMPDTAGAIGLQQLKKADKFFEIRKHHAALYNEAFAQMPEIELPNISEDVDHSWHLYIIQLNLNMLRIDRSAFIEELKKVGVNASVHYMPLHMHPYYIETYGYKPSDFPNAAALFERILSLPFYAKMSNDELEYVIESVKMIINAHRI